MNQSDQMYLNKITDYTQDLIELNLNHYLEREYGAGYEKHPHFYKLIKRNEFTHPDMLQGKHEAELAADLNRASIAKLLSSCKAKTEAIYQILRGAGTGKLKVNPRTRAALFRMVSRFKGPLYYVAGLFTSSLAGWLILLFLQRSAARGRTHST